MKQLFNRLPLEYPFILPEKELRKLLSDQEFALLEKISILALDTPLSNISCQTCGKFHEVHVPSQTEAFYVCPEAGKEMVDIHDLKRWRFQYEKLFDSLSRDLDITPEINEIEKGFCWQLGTIWLDNKMVSVYFFRGTVDDGVIKAHAGTIVITPQIQTTVMSNGLAVPVCLNDILVDKMGKSLWSEEKWTSLVINRSKKIIFESSGDLLVNGKRIVTVNPTSPQFYFLEILYANYNIAVGQEEIFAYCGQKLARLNGIPEWKSEYTGQTFCNKMKSLIKQVATEKKMIDMVIRAAKTSTGKNAYRLTYPD